MILSEFRLPVPIRFIVPLGNRGGFSGARLWRVETDHQPLCLRAWPTQLIDPDHVSWIHGLLRQAQARGLECVPRVLDTHDGRTCLESDGRLWDLTSWLPGTADFHGNPTTGRLQNASRVLAQLHQVWRDHMPPNRGVCPAIERRWEKGHSWLNLRRSGWDVQITDPLAVQARQLVDRLIDGVLADLQPWRVREMALQPCHGDPWHDHLLFTGDALTGLIDFGSARLDHAALDLARLLGSLVSDDVDSWELGLQAYRSIRTFSEEEAALATVLDRTSSVLSLATWLRWLYEENRHFDDRAAARRRFEELVRRVERRTVP